MGARLEIVVRSTEVDMLGHVNNAVYQQWFEWGRFEWVRWSKVDFKALSPDHLSLVVVHVSLDYRREARMDDRMVIETSLARLGTKSMTWHQKVLHADGTVAAEGDVVLAVFDTRTRRAEPMSDMVREALTPLLGA